MDLQLVGKTALVTGASMGIGRAIAKALAAEGVQVVAAARRIELMQVMADEVEAAQHLRPILVRQDVMEEDAAAKLSGAALDAVGRIDILVNNAGGSRRFTLESTEAQWEEALTLNFVRQRQLAHRLLPQMLGRKWGRVINITGKSEPEGLNGAFAAKAAMHSWAKGLSREVGKHGITVNCVPPGRIISEQILRNYPPEFRQRESEHDIPVGEYGQPQDLANLVCFLASPLARYITGAVIPVDGGLRRYQF
jgi:3-oxoacyl-[acyl-carrier protein] reductase